MDEGNNSSQSSSKETNSEPKKGTDSPPKHSSEDEVSSFSARPADKPLELPIVSNQDQLRNAASAVVQQGLSLSEAAEKFDVNPDTLFIWHRTYINFIGKDVVAASKEAVGEKPEFDRETSRKFDKNWAEMLRIWELERPQPSPLRKRLLSSPVTRWMFREEKLDKVTVAGAVAVLSFTGLAIHGGTNYLGKSSNQDPGNKREESLPLNSTDPDAFKGESKEARLEKVAAALTEFAKLETWQERLPFLRKPDEVKPLIELYYQTHADGSLDELVLNPQVSFIKRESAVFVLMQGQYTPKTAEFGEVEQIIFLAELQDEEPEFLFDWEVMVNYEPTPWEEFVASRTTTAARFRLRLANGDYYNQPFMDSEKFESYALLPLHRDQVVYGFVERNTPLAAELKKNLSKELSQKRAMILNLKFPENSKFDNVLEIESIVSDGWLEE